MSLHLNFIVCNTLANTYANYLYPFLWRIGHNIPRGLTARIAGFHPAGPGSTPGVGNTFYKSVVIPFA